MPQTGIIGPTLLVLLLAACGRDQDEAAATPPVNAQAVPAAAATQVMGGSGSGAEVYARACAMCHAAGVANAPRLGDAAAWAPRIAQGRSKLYMHAIDGYLGERGVMPPKGGHPGLPEADVRAAVDHIVAQVEMK